MAPCRTPSRFLFLSIRSLQGDDGMIPSPRAETADVVVEHGGEDSEVLTEAQVSLFSFFFSYPWGYPG